MDIRAGITDILGTERTMGTSRAGWGAPGTVVAAAAGPVFLVELRGHTVLRGHTALKGPRVLTALVNTARRKSSKGRLKVWGRRRYRL